MGGEFPQFPEPNKGHAHHYLLSGRPHLMFWHADPHPPNSSAVTSSPVAALTKGGPPKKMVPVLFTIIAWSDMAGT